MLTPDSSEPPDRPVVVRVTSRRPEPALVAATLVLGLVVLALWKPWVGGGQGADSTVPGATGLTAAVPSGVPRASASPATAGPAFEAVAPTLPSLFGLDLGSMGMTDPHPAWGIAVAYAPSANIALAVAGRPSTFTPVVDWARQGGVGPGPSGGSRPGPAGTGPIMDHPRTVTIAVAVTWPPMPRPRAVRLLRLGTIASSAGEITRLPTAQPLSLAEPLPLLVRMVPPGSDPFDPVPSVDWELASGTFFLPSHGPPAEVGGWLMGGWRPGAYAFVVTQADGTTRTLPFVLRG